MNAPKHHLPQLPQGRNYRFHAMIKPSGAECNIDCHYCFYLHKTDLLQHKKQSRMSDEVLEQTIRQYIDAQTGDQVVFSWQGGEPTLMGLDFFRRVVALQAKYKKPNQKIENDLQTNGILLDDAWVAFLKEHGFYVGLSIDGPKELHDIYRKNKGGRGTFDKVFAAAQLLSAAKVPFAALCVVNRMNARHPVEVYRFLADQLGTWRIQFNPIVEPVYFKSNSPNTGPDAAPVQGAPRARPGHPSSIVSEWSVDPDDYGTFLCAVWDEWLANDYGKIHVNLFETLVAQSMGMPAQTCTQAEFCGKGVAVEHDGDVFSCDHFVYPDYKIGNIMDNHLGDLAFSKRQEKFGFDKKHALPDKCKKCDYLKLCWGECPKNRIVKTAEGEAGLNYLCSGLYKFYSHVDRDVVAILKKMGRL